MRQRELEMRLERVPGPPRPVPHLEQYRTPSTIAADLLYRALALGDISDRRIVDLGAGTGIFAIGAMLLGARSALAVDVDGPALEAGREAARDLGVEVEFRREDVERVEGAFDTVLMNPPFGAQFAARHLDTLFLERARALAPTIYSLHLADTRRHLERWAAAHDRQVAELAQYDFPLPAQFVFHTRERRIVRVALLRFQPLAEGEPSDR